MGKATVYYFTYFDPDTGDIVRPRRSGTLEAIHNLGIASVKPLLRTAREVEEAELDEQGFYPQWYRQTPAMS